MQHHWSYYLHIATALKKTQKHTGCKLQQRHWWNSWVPGKNHSKGKAALFTAQPFTRKKEKALKRVMYLLIEATPWGHSGMKLLASLLAAPEKGCFASCTSKCWAANVHFSSHLTYLQGIIKKLIDKEGNESKVRKTKRRLKTDWERDNMQKKKLKQN